MFELFIARRYLRAKRKQVVISVITFISVLGVAAGVMALVIALAINNGFKNTLERNLLGATAHVSILEKAHVNVVDLTALGSDDPMNHGKFTQSGVVKAIGLRLASGQKLNDYKQTLGERVGGIVEGATDTVGKAAALAVGGIGSGE